MFDKSTKLNDQNPEQILSPMIKLPTINFQKKPTNKMSEKSLSPSKMMTCGRISLNEIKSYGKAPNKAQEYIIPCGESMGNYSQVSTPYLNG